MPKYTWERTAFIGIHTQQAKVEHGEVYAADLLNLRIDGDGWLRIRPPAEAIGNDGLPITGTAVTDRLLFLARTDGRLYVRKRLSLDTEREVTGVLETTLAPPPTPTPPPEIGGIVVPIAHPEVEKPLRWVAPGVFDAIFDNIRTDSDRYTTNATLRNVTDGTPPYTFQLRETDREIHPQVADFDWEFNEKDRTIDFTLIFTTSPSNPLPPDTEMANIMFQYIARDQDGRLTATCMFTFKTIDE